MNLAWLSRGDQERILTDIAASGATDVRLSLSRPVDKSIEALAIAHRLGLRILLEIQLGNKSYYPQSVGRERAMAASGMSIDCRTWISPGIARNCSKRFSASMPSAFVL